MFSDSDFAHSFACRDGLHQRVCISLIHWSAQYVVLDSVVLGSIPGVGPFAARLPLLFVYCSIKAWKNLENSEQLVADLKKYTLVFMFESFNKTTKPK